MDATDTYSSISAASKGLYKDQGSRFIALAYPVESVAQVKELVDAARKEYHDARHVCYAWRLGLGGELFRANDDGEPSGSAGRQILSRIDAAALSDVLIIVVRYFGGIKLGIPGLIKAYRSASDDALATASKVEKVAGDWYTLKFDYSQLPAVMALVKELDLPQKSQDFAQECSIELRVRKNLQEDFLQRIEKIIKFKDKIIKNE